MGKTDTCERRPLIFLTVLMLHIAIVLLVINTSRQRRLPLQTFEKSLILLLLPNLARTPDDVVASGRATPHLHSSTAKPRTPKAMRAPDNAITASPDKPQSSNIDWEQEVGLTAQNATTNAAKQTSYRDLSALSPAQMSWVRQNHVEPAEPGIPWKYRRIEIAQGGFPIIHINDHCVAIPLLMMMVFCKIGHIEPKGDLFEHMKDPHRP